MTAVLKYPGSKWSLADWIISRFPEHHSYLEPFFGSGAVLFNKPRSHIETVNDLDGEVVNFFQWVQRDPARLAEAVCWIPYAREAYDRACAGRETETDSFRRAVNFYICQMMGHGFRPAGGIVGWKNDVQGRGAAYAASSWCEGPETVLRAAERLRGVQIEHRPALEVIRRFNYPNVLIYVDPPYLMSVRGARQKLYRHEMTDQGHLELLEALRAHRGPVLLSGYASPLYDRVLEGWYKETATSQDQLSRKREEVLWMNFLPDGQERLF